MSLQTCVYIVDDDYAVRDSLGHVMEAAGLPFRLCESAEDFLQAYIPGQHACLLLDMNMPDMNGDELQAELIRLHIQIPVIFLTAFGDIPATVRAIKAGAVDFLTKPVPSKVLLERIETALRQSAPIDDISKGDRFNTLTAREMEVMRQVIAGHSNKEIARLLGISYRTVEIHRARVMEKTGACNLLDLARICSENKISSDPVE